MVMDSNNDVNSKEEIEGAIKSISEAVEVCKKLKTRIRFISKLKKDCKLRNKYIMAFNLIYKIYGYTAEQKKCYNRIRNYLT